MAKDTHRSKENGRKKNEQSSPSTACLGNRLQQAMAAEDKVWRANSAFQK
jgi:hypothetical protein